MNQNLWSMVSSINNLLTPLRAADSQSSIAKVDFVGLRSNLRAQMEDLREAITDKYTERDAYYVLFPLIAHCDEVVKKMIQDSKQLEWPPLQQEFYQVDEAGDLFYELLDNALSKPEILPLVYEVYYFCLHDGFCGRYSGNPDMVEVYLQKLRKYIHLQAIDIVPALSSATKRAYFRMPNYAYYCGAGLLLILSYGFLAVLASTWQPIK